MLWSFLHARSLPAGRNLSLATDTKEELFASPVTFIRHLHLCISVTVMAVEFRFAFYCLPRVGSILVKHVCDLYALSSFGNLSLFVVFSLFPNRRLGDVWYVSRPDFALKSSICHSPYQSFAQIQLVLKLLPRPR